MHAIFEKEFSLIRVSFHDQKGLDQNFKSYYEDIVSKFSIKHYNGTTY